MLKFGGVLRKDRQILATNWELLFPGRQTVYAPGYHLRGGIGPAMKQVEEKVDEKPEKGHLMRRR